LPRPTTISARTLLLHQSIRIRSATPSLRAKFEISDEIIEQAARIIG
jgi:hypothetical protein